MYPELFSIGNFTVHSYGFIMAVAVISGYYARCPSEGFSEFIWEHIGRSGCVKAAPFNQEAVEACRI